ncbi:MAG: hypothetical protein ACRD15_11235 [Vicinamibacterales bacterium]
MVSEDFEEWMAFVGAQLGPETSQEPGLHGSVRITGGDPPLVIVRLAPTRLTVWEYAARLDESSEPVVTPIHIGSISWRRLPDALARTVISSLIDAARESRLAKFSDCQFCDARKPPEWMHDDDVCLACAKQHLGVVF